MGAWFHTSTRFELVTRKFLKKRAIWWADPLKIAGGAKIFASPADESERQFALSQVQTSMRLHRTQRVMLMAHRDCGAYGGLQDFAGDEERDAGAPRSRVARCRGVFEIQGAEH